MTILDEIADKTRLRVAQAKDRAPFDQVQKAALALAENLNNLLHCPARRKRFNDDS